MAERKETVIIETDIDVGESVESINKLTAANKELRKERNELNISTDAGKKRAQEINTLIDSNTVKIKTNVSAIEQQKINIGNYQSALQGLNPQLGQMAGLLSSASAGAETLAAGTTATAAGAGLLTTVFKAATAAIKTAVRASLAFIATPLGAFLAAIVVAFKLLQSYLGGTQEGMDKITSVTRPLVAIFDRLIGVVQELGGKLFKALAEAIQNPIQALKDLGNAIVENVLNRFKAIALVGPAIAKIFSGDLVNGFKDLGNAAIQGVAGVENGIEKLSDLANGLSDVVEQAYLDGQRLDELQKSIERGEISRIVRSKELELIEKRNKAIVEDETKSFTEREAAALRARQAQDENERISLSLLDKRIEKIKIQQALNDTSREDEKELAELEAQRLETQAVAVERAIEFDKKINELRKQRNDQEKLARIARLDRELEGERPEDPLTGVFETEVKIETDITKLMREQLIQRGKDLDKYYKDKNDKAQKSADLQFAIQQAELSSSANLAGALSGLLQENSAEQKFLLTAQALINTYAAANAALRTGSEINPFVGFASAAAAVIAGLANVAKINGVEFAEGGYTGPGPKHKPAGTVHAGEVVWNQEDVKQVGGPAAANAMRPTAKRMHAPSYGRYLDGGVVTTSISQPINQQLELLNIVKNMPNPVVSAKEITKVQKRVEVKEQISKR